MNDKIRSAQILLFDGKEITDRPFFRFLIQEIVKDRTRTLECLRTDPDERFKRRQGEVEATDRILRMPKELLDKLESEILLDKEK